jgi:hypothetical protein
MVDGLPPAEESQRAVAYPNVVKEKHFTDAAGMEWTRRGAELSAAQIGKLITDPAVRVLHEYLHGLDDVPADDRSAFWATAVHEDC